jgi:hypothetical protein
MKLIPPNYYRRIVLLPFRMKELPAVLTVVLMREKGIPNRPIIIVILKIILRPLHILEMRVARSISFSSGE